MFRVAEAFRVGKDINLIEKIPGLHIGKPTHKIGDGLFVVYRDCHFVKDYDTRENYEKNFMILNDEMTNILSRLGVKNIPSYEKRIKVYLLDEPAEEPMTFRKWHEMRHSKTI